MENCCFVHTGGNYMKFYRKIEKKLLLITAIFAMVLCCAPIHLKADGLLADSSVTVVDATNAGVRYYTFSRSGMSYTVPEDDSKPHGKGDVGKAEDGGNQIPVGTTYTVIYPNAITYDKVPYSVKVDITYKGKNFFYNFIHSDARSGGWIEGVYYGKHDPSDSYNDVFLNAFGLNYEITVSFWKNTACTESASLYAGIVLSDPDQGNYTLNTPVKYIYYIDAQQVGGNRRLKDAYTYSSTNITHIKEGDDGNHVSWSTWPDFNEGEFGFYNDTPTHSYTYTVEGKQDVIRVLSKIMLVKVPYNVHYFYQNDDGSWNTTPDYKTEDISGGTRYANAGSTVSVTDADKTPNPEKGDNYYLDTSATRTAEGTKQVADDGSTVLNVYFKKSKYNVHYFYQNDNGTYNDTPDYATEVDNYAGGTRYATSSTVTVTDADKIPDPAKGDLYFLDETKNEDWTETPVADDGTTVLNVYFKKIGYNVEYYYQKEGKYNFEEPDYKTETPRYATYGTTEVEATDADKTPNPEKGPQYILDPDTTIQTELKKALNPDGSTVLRVYFKEDLKVTYHDNADKVVFEDDLKPDLEYGTPTPSFSGSTDREGYDFLGWSKKPEDKINLLTQEQINNIKVTEVADYWAQWEPWKYTIKYEPNGGSGEMEDNVYLLADKNMESDLNRFKRSGYKFTGFLYTDPQGHQTMYKDINDFREQFMKLGKNSVIVLVAQWTKEKSKATTYTLPVTGVK